jgi:hypothetical protein
VGGSILTVCRNSFFYIMTSRQQRRGNSATTLSRVSSNGSSGGGGNAVNIGRISTKDLRESSMSTFTPNSSVSTLDKYNFGSGFGGPPAGSYVEKFPSVSSAPSVDFQSSKQATRDHFLKTPLISGRRRDPLDCFGVIEEDVEPLEKVFSRASLRTPPEIREFILKERKDQKERLERTVALARTQKEMLKYGPKVDMTMIGFGRGYKNDIGRAKPEPPKAAPMTEPQATSTKQASISKRVASGDLYDVSAKANIADESTKFFFSEAEKERRKAAKDEQTALLLSRKQKAMSERSAKIEKAQSIKNSQKYMLEKDMYDPAFESVKHKYVGLEAKEEFVRLYMNSRNANYVYPTDDDLPQDLKSPHMLLMREQSRRGLAPLPLILRSENRQKGIFLGHKGLGDERALPVISILDTLPAVFVIDLSDNRLTDVSLMPLAMKLSHLPNLTSLNLSFNKIDDSSETIMAYLRNRQCKLRILTLNEADIDDDECVNLMDAIGDNRSIDTLSISNNLIGKNEVLNTVYPDLITGGESIAQLLLVTTSLRSLDVSWNFIRLASAEEIGRCMSINISLRILNISHNAFGEYFVQLYPLY